MFKVSDEFKMADEEECSRWRMKKNVQDDG